MLKDDALSVLELWDSYTKDLNRIYGLLMEGKSELAAIILQERKSMHNGQSRELLHRMLTTLSLKEVKG